MRLLLLVVWLLLPIGAAAYHFGPGQQQQKLDQVALALAQVDQLAQSERWDQVIEACDAALSQLPKDQTAAQRKIVLERAKAKMLARQLPEAHGELATLVDDLAADPAADEVLKQDARAAFANAQYYLTWLKRLEGKPEEEWMPHIESSRQIYRQLAEAADAKGEAKLSDQFTKDLESSIRLARMDLGELQGLPLPSQ